jgi:hypothetical protein
VRLERRVAGILLIAIAVTLGSYGAWLIASEDIQGGRDAVGAMFLAVAAFAAIVAAILLVVRRRRA